MSCGEPEKKNRNCRVVSMAIFRKPLEFGLFVRVNRGIVGCCRLMCKCGGALPLVEIWSHEFVNKLV